MKLFKYLMLGLMISLNSFAENGLSMFKSDVQPLVKRFVNNEHPKEIDIIILLNKEFGKDILFLKKVDDDYAIRKNKNVNITEKELNKLKAITKYLTDETLHKKGSASSYVGIVEMEFDY